MNRSRYLKIIFFFGRMILNVIFWELILRRIGFRKLTQKTRSNRMVRYARNFRFLAIQMGGVMIKVGQFFSARADVLPIEITAELSGLQDEVPPANFEDIKSLAEAELGGSLDNIYEWFDITPLAAASLGQVHRAKLKPAAADEEDAPTFQDVVVKIQRPDIEEVIATDLSALRVVGKWLMRYRPIRKRADIPAMLNEFTRILYEEIDYIAEGHNAETFAENLKDDPRVVIPAVIWPQTTRRVLTLEDVYAIKITDYEAITQAGIDLSEVAIRLFEVYLTQIFEDGFIHADPHPGNLFVNPTNSENPDDPEWQLVFVDFGMVARIPPGTKSGLRELAIAVGTKDSQRMVASFQTLNVLLPSADLDLIAQAEAVALDRFWGKTMEELNSIPFEELHEIAQQFRELIFSMPFQVPQDLIFLARTVAILSGMCTGLDPNFNFFVNITPFAKKLLVEESGSNWDYWLSEVGSVLLALAGLPKKMENTLGILARGDLKIQSPQLDRSMRSNNRALRQLVSAVVFFTLLTNGVLLYINDEILFSRILLVGSLIPLIALIFPRSRRRL